MNANSPGTKANDRGTILWRISKKFQFAADKIIPDSFVFCLILTFIVFIAGIIVTGTNPIDMLNYWYDGVWSQVSFAFQMSFMVVVCATTAKSPLMKKWLDKIASLPKSVIGAMVLMMCFGYVSSFLNWAFCTIVTPILAMQLSKKVKGLHFPLMIAAGYATMILGQCLGPSVSVYALLATPGHFLEDKMGVLTQDQTVYNAFNVTLWIILAVSTMLIAVFTIPPKDEVVMFEDVLESTETLEEEESITIADKLNNNKILMWAIGAGGLIIIGNSFIKNGFLGSLSINFVIFLFLIANCFLYNTPRKFVSSLKNSMSLATEVMIQFPFYGGIAGVMGSSGFAAVVANSILQVATPVTMPLFSYISASFVNLFIPSQGGQWIVQGDILVTAAQGMGANVIHVVNGFVHGDEATNLLQPLYVIPALSVVGMKLKDVWGFMAFIWMFWAVITCLGFYFLPLWGIV